MAEAKYRVGIIGTGRMGGLIEDELASNQFSSPYGHYSSYLAIPETSVVAVANRGVERLERFSKRFGIDNLYLDYREMIEKENLDIVSVTTPSFARAEPIVFAAEHGVRGIYSEKGLCASLQEADRIAASCRRNSVAFNWGAMRRHHNGFLRLRDAIGAGDIGEPKYALMYSYTDLIKHHPHTLDLVAMLVGDPLPQWVEGTFARPGSALAGDGPRQRPRSYPRYDSNRHAFVPPDGEEIADPMVDFFRVGYEGGVEGHFLPVSGMFDVEVYGSEGRAYAWDNGELIRVRCGASVGNVEEVSIVAQGDSPTVSTIRNIIQQLETGERTAGNIDITMRAVEVQFALAHSHLNDGIRTKIPVADRTLYIPGG